MKAAIYARSATVGEGEGAAPQVEALRVFCQEQGFDLVAVFVDDGVSSTVPFGSRPGGVGLLEAARNSEFGAVLVQSLDRFSRDPAALSEALDDLREAGVAIRSITQPWTQTPETCRVMGRILALMALPDVG